MIVEIDTHLLEQLEGISLNQLVFLSLVINNQPNQSKLQSLFSLMNSNEIQETIDIGYIEKATDGSYSPTNQLIDKIGKEKDLFQQFYDAYPVYVIRPDNTKDYLRANVNKCRKVYNQIIGKSKAQHEHILNCLYHDIDTKATTGKLCYMKRMWQWLTSREWESVEQSLTDTTTQTTEITYGTDIKW